MPEAREFSVAVAQRRLLEAVAAYGGDRPRGDQQELQMALSRGVLTASAAAVHAEDCGAADVYAALSELIACVVIDQLKEASN